MKQLITIVLIFVASINAHAQLGWETSISPAYLVSGGIQFIEGYADIGDGPSYQFNIGTSMATFRDLEFEFKLTPGQEIVFTPNSPNTSSFEAFKTSSTTYSFALNGLNYFSKNEKRRFYAIFGIGLAIHDIKDKTARDMSAMTFRLGAGYKHYFEGKWGLRIQASYFAPFQISTAGVYAGVGSGGSSLGLSLNAWTIYSQGDFSIGCIYRLN